MQHNDMRAPQQSKPRLQTRLQTQLRGADHPVRTVVQRTSDTLDQSAGIQGPLTQKAGIPNAGTRKSGSQTSVAPTSASLPHLRRQIAKQMLILAALAGAALLLRDKIAALDLPAIKTAFLALSPWQWAGAALATAASFGALAQYDVVLHRLLGTHQPAGAARRAGWVAIALSQTLGFGLISGALLRWRMLRTLSLFDASRLTAAVAASFLAAWALLAALAVLALPVTLPGTSPLGLRALAGLALVAGGALAAASLLRPDLTIMGRKIRRPRTGRDGLCALAATPPPSRPPRRRHRAMDPPRTPQRIQNQHADAPDETG